MSENTQARARTSVAYDFAALVGLSVRGSVGTAISNAFAFCLLGATNALYNDLFSPSTGIANFILCPVILLWQILYSFYNYAEMIKREPGFFGTRAWSHYGSIYLRHFNELDHEYVTRLSRGYKGEGDGAS